MAGHCARIHNSKRLQIILAILSDCRWHTTLEISEESARRGWRNMAVSAAIKEVRDNDIPVACRRVGGAKVPTWEYRLGR